MSAYTEDHLIEQPAIQLMEHELGWNSVNAYEPPSSRDAGLRRSSWLANCPETAVEVLARDSFEGDVYCRESGLAFVKYSQ